MTQIAFQNDVTGALEFTHGSDGRFNVSSRSDARAYYNSRDVGQTYTMVWDHTGAAIGEYSFYLQNTSPTLELVCSNLVINSETSAEKFKLFFVTGVAGDGATVTPTNLNKGSSNAAAATALESAGGQKGASVITARRNSSYS